MSIFDSVKSFGKKLGKGAKKLYDITALNVKIIGLNSDMQRVRSRFHISALIYLSYDSAMLIKKLKEYDAEYGDNIKFRNAINEYEALCKRTDEHNKIVTFILDKAKEFGPLYDSVIENPVVFDAVVLQRFFNAIAKAKEFTVLTDEVKSFVSKYDDLENDYSTILEQFKMLPKVRALLEFKEDKYVDAFEEKAREQKLLSLLGVSTGKIYYKFPMADDIKKAVTEHNAAFIKAHLSDAIFDDVNGISLDDDQRRAILCDEATNLVVAGAGSGKTATICGKVKYLIDVIGVAPEDILLLSYSKASATDLNTKAQKISPDVEAKTFHATGLDILKVASECTFVIENQFEKIIEDFFENELINRSELLSKVISYYGLYSASIDETKKFKAVGDLFEAARNNNYKTLKDRLIEISSASSAKPKEEHL